MSGSSTQLTLCAASALTSLPFLPASRVTTTCGRRWLGAPAPAACDAAARHLSLPRPARVQGSSVRGQGVAMGQDLRRVCLECGDRRARVRTCSGLLWPLLVEVGASVLLH
jgi:hypothetical protein